MTTYIFPGQGSQTKGMGKDLFQLFPDLTQQANDLLGYSIEELCLHDPNDQLNNTLYTQPALYVVNALSFLKKRDDSGITPDYVAGHSLGEYNALFAAGVFDFTTGLQLVKKRGELMSQAAAGGMAAIVGLQTEAVAAILSKQSPTTVSIANYNSHTQVVITGLKETVLALQPLFANAGATFIPLKVSGAFHSTYMASAQHQFATFIQKITYSLPRIAIIANVNALPYQVDALHTTLSNQLTQPVKWVQSMEYLIRQGETVFEEVGPGTVLTGLIKRIQKKL